MHLEVLQYNDLELLIKRKAHRRRVSLVVRPHELPVVKTSLHMSNDELLQFVRQQESWLRRALESYKDQPAPIQWVFAEGKPIPYLGELKKIKPMVTVLEKSFVRVEGEDLEIYLPEKIWSLQKQFLPKLIQQFYLKASEALLSERFMANANRLQLFPKQLKFSRAKSRWGSLSSLKILRLNRSLIFAPKHVIDSVVIHELCHLRHFNHSADFWNLVSMYCPDHKECSQWLEEHRHWFKNLQDLV